VKNPEAADLLYEAIRSNYHEGVYKFLFNCKDILQVLEML
jgi:hypothetical protein